MPEVGRAQETTIIRDRQVELPSKFNTPSKFLLRFTYCYSKQHRIGLALLPHSRASKQQNV